MNKRTLLEKEYRVKLESWDWDGLKMTCQQNAEPDRDNPGQMTGSAFVGTVFQLTPSGKYYTPLACGNVNPCSRCKGQGKITNRRQNPEVHAQATQWANDLRAYAMRRYGPWADKKWSKAITQEIEQTDKQVKQTAPEITCPACDGVGSVEAFQDEVWQEVFESVAESHGMFVTSGEGDPCDVLVAMVWDQEEAQED